MKEGTPLLSNTTHNNSVVDTTLAREIWQIHLILLLRWRKIL